jgi:DNA-directed RNA polymerase specialized sigma24 family protein
VAAGKSSLPATEARVERYAEQELLDRIRRGDRAAREELVVDYYRRVYAMLAHLAGDVHLAEDLTQETFAAALAGVERFSGRSTLVTWLYRIAYHKLVDAKRRENSSSSTRRRFRRTQLRRTLWRWRAVGSCTTRWRKWMRTIAW